MTEIKQRGGPGRGQPVKTGEETVTVSLRMTSAQFHTKIDREKSLAELLRRCPECRARYEEMQNAS